MTDFDTAYNDPSLQKIISQDTSLAANIKVRSVPTLFINGRLVKNRSFNTLSNMVASELKKNK